MKDAKSHFILYPLRNIQNLDPSIIWMNIYLQPKFSSHRISYNNVESYAQIKSIIKIAFLFSGPIAIMNKCVRTVSVKESAPDSIR